MLVPLPLINYMLCMAYGMYLALDRNHYLSIFFIEMVAFTCLFVITTSFELYAYPGVTLYWCGNHLMLFPRNESLCHRRERVDMGCESECHVIAKAYGLKATIHISIPFVFGCNSKSLLWFHLIFLWSFKLWICKVFPSDVTIWVSYGGFDQKIKLAYLLL
jgi:hypothetical protein